MACTFCPVTSALIPTPHHSAPAGHWPSRCLIPGLCILLLSRILFLQVPSWSSSIIKAIDPKCRTFIPLESRRLSHIGAWKRASSWVSLLANGQGTLALPQLTGYLSCSAGYKGLEGRDKALQSQGLHITDPLRQALSKQVLSWTNQQLPSWCSVCSN